METVLASNNTTSNNNSATEAKSKDFNPSKMPPVANRNKKPKKKKNSGGGGNKSAALIRNPANNHGSYDRFHSYDFSYTSVSQNRSRLGLQDCQSSADNSNYPVVDEILNSLEQKKGKILLVDSSEGDGSDKQQPIELGSPPHEDFGSSPEDSTPSSDFFSPSRVPLVEDEVKQSQPFRGFLYDLNDLDEDDIYIRKNRSNVSLNGSAQETSPEASGKLQQDQKQNQQQYLQNKANGVHGLSTVSSSRLNFRSANGLLYSTVSCEDHLVSGLKTLPQEAENPPHEMDPGLRNLQSLFQMNSNLHMANLLPALVQQLPQFQFPAVNNNGLHSSSLQSTTAYPLMQQLAPQQFVQGLPAVLGNVSNLPALHSNGLQCPDLVMNGMEEFRKQKESPIEGSSCFYYKSTNDLDQFLTHTTPVLPLDPALEVQEAIDRLTLRDLWTFYYEASMLGREIPLQKHQEKEHGNQSGPSCAYYLPYLSGMQLFVPDDLKEDSVELNNSYICDVNDWPLHMKKHYEHFEVNPPWFRKPLYDMMDELSEEKPELLTMKLKDLHPASWFCVAWYPLYRIPDAPLVTRFLTFHSFHPPEQETNLVRQGGSVPLAVYGLEWYNMKDELWMDNIKIGKDSRSSTPSRSNNLNWNLHEGEVENAQQLNWLQRIRYLMDTAKTFARGLSLRRKTRHGSMEVNMYHHDFEYFYERN
eukprot:g3450.t1